MPTRLIRIIASAIIALVGFVFVITGVHLWQRAHDTQMDGTWVGTVSYGRGMNVRFCQMIGGPASNMTASITVPELSWSQYPADSVSFDGSHFTFTSKTYNASYVGTMAPDGQSIEGALNLNGGTYLLTLDRVQNIDL